MKTYLLLWFNSDGASTTEVTDRLMSMGFRPIHGNYDYVYDWGKEVQLNETIGIADQVHATLSGCNVTFKVETI